MRICNLRVRIVRDGHEPNEAEEQRLCRVPIEPVHVISSPKDRRDRQVVRIQVRSVSLTGVLSRLSIRHLSSARSSCHLLALKPPFEVLLRGLLPALFRAAFSPRAPATNIGAAGRCSDLHYCTTSPCNARSRPSRSTTAVTRRPTNILTTKRMIRLTTAS